MDLFKSNKGWMRIFEVVVIIFLLVGVLVLILTIDNTKSLDLSRRVHSLQSLILMEIQINNDLRNSVLGTTIPESGIIKWDEDSFPSGVKTKIESRTPGWLSGCIANICEPSDNCILAGDQLYIEDIRGRDIYAHPVMIVSNLTHYNPRMINLFCWE
ncbi:hypothetical protein K0A97_03435 [Patescibacteria group bacterium]|nr:hypothetical protein [Patescibacteria group bacterium]